MFLQFKRILESHVASRTFVYFTTQMCSKMFVQITFIFIRIIAELTMELCKNAKKLNIKIFIQFNPKRELQSTYVLYRCVLFRDALIFLPRKIFVGKVCTRTVGQPQFGHGVLF